MDLRTVTAEDVLYVHDVLVSEFSATNDPISPPGVRSMDLLQSAVGRQHTSIGRVFKYPDPIDNASTLLYGICNDHPFHNGNKRTALVSMLVHLDKNKLALFDATQSELYALMLRVASHTLIPPTPRRVRRPRRVSSDDEVAVISKWLKTKVGSLRRGERNITYRELKRVLEEFGFQLENPTRNMIEVIKYEEEVTRGLLGKRRVTVRRKFGNVPRPGDNSDIGINEIKRVREMCHLREEDGVDSDCFYTQTAMIDAFVNRYRTLLRKLART